MKNTQPNIIGMEQLRVGLYIHLDLGWMDHPFTFSNFKIANEQQLAQVKRLSLKSLRYDPLRSDCEPLPAIKPPPVLAETPVINATEETEEERQAFQLRRVEQLHQAIHACEKKFVHASMTVREIEQDIKQNPARSLQQAQTLVECMVDSILMASDVVMHAMQGDVEQHSHALNVTVLALTMAKALDMTEQDANWLGHGALFHDIGKNEIPDRVTKKTEPLTHAEQTLLEQHCEIGARITTEMGMHARVVNIIQQHHEYMDGSGYPAQLRQDEIDCLTRIVTVANVFENLCNPVNMPVAMTPYEALAHMFAHIRGKFDTSLLTLLIKSLGVYPPGSIVQLSDGSHGIVMSVNPNKPLLPFVMLHDPDVPRDTPKLINLGGRSDLRVTRCLRRDQLPKEALDYLNPSRHISYFYDKEIPSNGKAS